MTTYKELLKRANKYGLGIERVDTIHNGKVYYVKGTNQSMPCKTLKDVEVMIKKMGQQPVCKYDGTKLRYYDGALGYEAVFCPTCGYFADHSTEGKDESFIGKKGESFNQPFID